MYLIDPNLPQFKANLHSHSTLSDGKRTPRELKEMYKERGYKILSITDHEYPKDHSALNEPGFLTVTGYEVYIRPGKTGEFDIFAPEVHLNLFARDSANQTFVCPDSRYEKYLRRTPNKDVTFFGSNEPREYSVKYINEFIKTAKEAGYLVAYNHPYWSFENEWDIMQYEGFFSMEIYNYGSDVLSHLEYCGAFYNRLLRSGKRVFCHAGDDNHNSRPEGHYKYDSFGAFTMIMAPKLEYGSVIDAMERGNMYSSMGPTFKEVSIKGNKLHVECSPVKCIIVYDGSKRPLMYQDECGKLVTSADFELNEKSMYVRVNICDENNLMADTRGFFRDELPF